MKKITLSLIIGLQLFASPSDITSFDADFVQNITDEKNKILTYKGHVIASKPQSALWNYTFPVEKSVYINGYDVTIIEPEIEQVIIRRVNNDFDFFKMIKNAKKIKENTYEALYKDTVFTIKLKEKSISSISYLDNFDNKVNIIFSNQKQNTNIDKNLYKAKFPLDYDIIRD